MKVNYWHKLDHNCYYHIYNRTVSDELLFRDESDYLFFLKKYKLILSPYCHTYAYALMPNHYHLIIKMKAYCDIAKPLAQEISTAAQKYQENESLVNEFMRDQIRRMFSSIPIRYNNKYKRRGPLLQPRTKRIFIDNPERVKYLIAYTHHNAIHHKLESCYGQWRYDSFNAYMSDSKTGVVTKEGINLFDDKESFEDYHRSFKILKMEESIDGGE